MSSWLGYILLGKILIYLWQKFPFPRMLYFLKDLHECDLCSGVWIYFFAALVFKMDLLHLFGFSYYPILNEGITGGIVSFVVHIFSIGWKTKFDSGEVVIK